jgi:hypothetical protein
MTLDEDALEAAWLAHDNAIVPQWQKKERMRIAIETYLDRVNKKPKPICPFSREYKGPDLGLEPEDPCPVCGMLGTFSSLSDVTEDKCVDKQGIL